MEVYSGYLTVKISGRLKNKTFSNSWCILSCAKSGVPPCLDIYENKTKIDPLHLKKSIEIFDAQWGKVDSVGPAFCFSIEGKRYIFSTNSMESCKIWQQYLCCISADLFASKKRLEDSGDRTAGDDDGVVMQDNCLYTSNNDVASFDVVANQDGSCPRFGFKGLMKLCFNTECIKLFEIDAQSPVAEWSFYSIRSFGCSSQSLNIFTGKKSTTGEGNFSFISTEGNAMVDLITFHTKRLKERERAQALNEEHVSNGSGGEKSKSVPFNSSTRTKQAPSILSPKPISPLPNHSSNAFASQFKDELDKTIGNALLQGERRQPLERKLSNSNTSSSESLVKINSKKVASQKEKKAKEKVEKKLSKEREKKEKEEQRQLKKKERNSKDKQPKPVVEPVESLYSEVYENPSQGNYTDFNNGKELSRYDNQESDPYHIPWGSLPIPIQKPKKSDDDQDEYATPIKTLTGKGKDKVEQHFVQPYEDVEPLPIFSPISGAPEDDVYDHFVEATPIPYEEPENLYGLDSAKSISDDLKQKPPKPNPHSCLYEIVN